MVGLQGIDSDYTNLTSGNTPLTSDRYTPALTPITEGSYQGSQGNVPVSYLQPTSKDLTSQETTPGQDIQSKVQGVQKPDFGKLLLLGLIGGPNAVNQYYARTMQKQVEPIIQDISLQYRQALNAGDFSGAQKIVSQLGPLTPYSPNAGKLLESFTDIINKRQDNVRQNKLFIGEILKTGQAKVGSPYYNYLTDPSTLLQDKEVVQKSPEIYGQSGQVIGGFYTTTNKINAEITSQQVTPQQSTVENMPKAVQNSLIEKVGPTAPTRFAFLQSKQSLGQITPDELNELNMFNKVVGPQAAFNVGAERLPIEARIRANLRPGLSEEMNSPEGSTSQGQGNTQGKVAKGNAQQGQNLNQQRIIFEVNEMFRNNEINEQQRDTILKNRGITVTQPQGNIPQGPYQEARASETAANVQQSGQTTAAQEQAQTQNRTLGLAGKVALGVVNGKIVKDSNMSASDAKNKGLMVADLPGEESQFATKADQATSTIDSMTHNLLSETGRRAELGWFQAAMRGVAGGLGISILGTTLESSSIDVPNMNATQKRVFAQGEALAEDLKKIYGDAPKMWKSQLTRSMTSRDDMLQALGEIRSDILDRAATTFKSQKSSEPPRGNVSVPQGSKVQPGPVEQAPVQQQSKGTKLDRSKFKAVAP